MSLIKCPFCAEEIQEEAKICKHCQKNLIKKSFYKKTIPIKKIFFWLIFFAIIWWIYNFFQTESQRIVQNSQIQTNLNEYNIDDVLDFSPISTGNMGGGMVSVKVKITNITDKDISHAQVTCVLLDRSEQEIGFAKHYVIKSTEGGLAGKSSTYFEFIIEVSNPNEIKKFNFVVEELKFK